MKRLKAIRLFIAFSISFLVASLLPLPAYAGYDYTIDNYQVMITVNEDNSFIITENIGAYFHAPRRGIIRMIPKRNEVMRLDGTVSRNRAKISGIVVNEPYKAYNENGYRALRIGDPDVTIKGSRLYSLRYIYDIGKDKGKGYDEFYFNIIGADWDTTIENVSFTINMPKDFDRGMLGFSAGALDSTNSDGIEYTVSGRTITGRYTGKLQPEEGLTVRLQLPEGYFKTGFSIDFVMLAALALIIALTVMYYRVWDRYGGKALDVVETVEFYPAQGLNSAEVAFWHKGSADSKDIVSLLIYLANQGYISIAEREAEKGGILRKKAASAAGFTIAKVKDYQGNKAHEREFLSGLFRKKAAPVSITAKSLVFDALKGRAPDAKAWEARIMGELASDDQSTDTESSVTDLDLKNKFYTTLNKITTDMNKTSNKHKVFEKSSLGKRWPGGLIAVVIYLLVTAWPLIEYEGISMDLIILVFPAFGFTAILISLIFAKGLGKLFLVFWGLLFGGVPWFLYFLPILRENNLYLISNAIGYVCIITVLVLIKKMPKRTPLGNELLGKIGGFKNFLDTVEKPRLEELVNENPTYFYDILPYTYVLGVSDKWIKKFETIATQPPDWYAGRSHYSHAAFGSFVRSTMNTATTAMSSSPSSSSGSSSGGGSSGRGSGGGGGRSW